MVSNDINKGGMPYFQHSTFIFQLKTLIYRRISEHTFLFLSSISILRHKILYYSVFAAIRIRRILSFDPYSIIIYPVIKILSRSFNITVHK